MTKFTKEDVQASVYGSELYLGLRFLSKWARGENNVRQLANQFRHYDGEIKALVARKQITVYGQDLYSEFPNVKGYIYDPLIDDLMLSIRRVVEFLVERPVKQSATEEFANGLEIVRRENLSAGQAQWNARHSFATVATVEAPSGVSIPIYINGFPMYPPQPMATWYTAAIYGGPNHGAILLNDYVSGPNRVYEFLANSGWRPVPGRSNLYWR